MRRRDISTALIASATGAALLSRNAQSQTCTPPCYARTAAEISAGVTPTNTAYPQGDLLRYGADPSGATSSDTAMANAISVCGTNGGTIRAAPGTYLFNSQINLTGKRSIIIQGCGAAGSGNAPATVFKYAGTGTGAWILINTGASGCQIRGVQLVHTSTSFTGIYIQCSNLGGSDPNHNGIYDCTLGAIVGTGTTHLNLDKCTNFTTERCVFLWGNPSVQGQAHAGGSYSNVIRFRDCEWYTQVVAPIQDCGQGWSIEGCTFEKLNNGAAGAIVTNPAASTAGDGISIKGCWFGDVSGTGGGSWISGFFAGASIEGNYFADSTLTATHISLWASGGVAINGNTFDHGAVALQFNSGFGTGHGVDFSGNFLASITTPIAGAANGDPVLVFNPNYPMLAPPDPSNGTFAQSGCEISPNGIIRQWGIVSGISIGTPVTVNFPRQFSSHCWNIVLTFTGAPGANNIAYCDTIGSASFRLLTGGAAGSAVVFWQAIGN